jgi:hypothetical protein
MLKKIIRKIDSIFLGKALQHQFARYLSTKQRGLFESSFDYRIMSFYQKNMNCEISRLCDVYGSDKGELIKGSPQPYSWPSHTYADFYTNLFFHCRTGVTKVFECGLGTNNPSLASSMGIYGKPGASLRVWRDYFPNAIVYGADIDKDILFEEERIKTFYVNQLDPLSINSFWKAVGVSDFDFMIDDGLHTFEAGSTLFLNSIDKLSSNGIYIIEDVPLFDLIRFKEFFNNYKYIVEYLCLFGPSPSKTDNNLIVVRKSS